MKLPAGMYARLLIMPTVPPSIPERDALVWRLLLSRQSYTTLPCAGPTTPRNPKALQFPQPVPWMLYPAKLWRVLVSPSIRYARPWSTVAPISAASRAVMLYETGLARRSRSRTSYE